MMIHFMIGMLYLIRAVQYGNPISVAIAILFLVLILHRHRIR